MKKIMTVTVFTASFAALAACSNDPQINAAVGGLTGAAVGTQIGSGSGRTAAILGGGAIGAATGAALTQPSHSRY
ncbi:glycine zipper 2TM domain-containing protein [Roseinatronobacter sp.]|uniref:glycine zipper 2TM domain-containing protein n=1 Tax=Roseinatronobacter sp. TaxID=1945755 RepID=UPI0025EE770F|nr:glycine zipper 2TM domain-containing protein [Rhodobaca sp.]